jgi:hypothetical protein
VQHIDRPFTLIEEDPQSRNASPVVRVEKMFELIKAKLPGPPEFILCVLPERKNSEIYGMAFFSSRPSLWQDSTFFDHIISPCSFTLSRALEEEKSK